MLASPEPESWAAHRRLYGLETLLELVSAITRLTGDDAAAWSNGYEDAHRLAAWLGQREGLGAAMTIALEQVDRIGR